MGNRSNEQKILKMKRRGRFARFSGASAKHAFRIERKVVMTGEDKTEVKEFYIPVGKISLSKQTISTGRGPDAERMAEYYSRVSPESFQTPLEEKNFVLDEFQHVLAETPRENRLKIQEDETGSLHLFWIGAVYFFVEKDLIERVIRRSRDYNGRAIAFSRHKAGRISWSSILPIE